MFFKLKEKIFDKTKYKEQVEVQRQASDYARGHRAYPVPNYTTTAYYNNLLMIAETEEEAQIKAGEGKKEIKEIKVEMAEAPTKVNYSSSELETGVRSESTERRRVRIETVKSGDTKVGRNDPCPCGKTKEDGTPVKYKNCHGKGKA
jgi:uncharacterized protein YecA (UPF0149 family)